MVGICCLIYNLILESPIYFWLANYFLFKAFFKDLFSNPPCINMQIYLEYMCLNFLILVLFFLMLKMKEKLVQQLLAEHTPHEEVRLVLCSSFLWQETSMQVIQIYRWSKNIFWNWNISWYLFDRTWQLSNIYCVIKYLFEI